MNVLEKYYLMNTSPNGLPQDQVLDQLQAQAQAPTGDELQSAELTPDLSLQKRRRYMLLLLAAVGVVVLVVGAYIGFTLNRTSSSTVSEDQSTEKELTGGVSQKSGVGSGSTQTQLTDSLSGGSQQVLQGRKLEVAGVVFTVPTDWQATISQQTKNAFSAKFHPVQSGIVSAVIDIQVGSREQVANNPLYVFSSEETLTNNALTYTLREGEDTFTKRNVVQAEYVLQNTTVLITLTGSSDEISSQRRVFDLLVTSVAQDAQKASYRLFPTLIKQAQAQSDTQEMSASSSAITSSAMITTVAGFPVAAFKQVSVMEGPYPERLTTEDYSYKDGFARLYTFEALKGQRLEVLAEEGQGSGSFINTQLYDEQGKLMIEAQTRLSLDQQQRAPYSGRYYLVVHSMSQKTGPYLLKIFDLDQTQELMYVRYSTGEEFVLNSSGGVGRPHQALFMISFTAPVEVLGNSVRYYRTSDNGCIACSALTDSGWFGEVTVPIKVIMSDKDNTSAPQEVPIKVTKVFQNQVLVQTQTGEPFPRDKQLRLELSYGPHRKDPGASSGISYWMRTY